MTARQRLLAPPTRHPVQPLSNMKGPSGTVSAAVLATFGRPWFAFINFRRILSKCQREAWTRRACDSAKTPLGPTYAPLGPAFRKSGRFVGEAVLATFGTSCLTSLDFRQILSKYQKYAKAEGGLI